MIACTVCVLLIATEGKTVLPFVAHTSKRKCFLVQNCYIFDSSLLAKLLVIFQHATWIREPIVHIYASSHGAL